MPFKSQAQRKWMYSTHPKMAKEWEDHTPKGKKLPTRKKKMKKKTAQMPSMSRYKALSEKEMKKHMKEEKKVLKAKAKNEKKRTKKGR